MNVKKRVMHVAGNNLLDESGFSQQFFMEVVALKQHGYDVTVLSFCHFKYFMNKEKLNNLRDKYREKGIDIIIVPCFLVGRMFIEYLYFPVAFFVAAYLIFFANFRIFHVHSLDCIQFFLPFKLFLPLMVLHDVHGVVIEEKIYNNLLVEGSLQHKYLNMVEKIVLKYCDVNFCVSQKMIDFYCEKHTLDCSLFQLTRSTYDQEIFGKYDYTMKEKAKKNLGLEEKLVFLYMGHKKAWQLTEEVVKLFVSVRKKFENSVIIFLSNDIDGITNLLKENNIQEDEFIVAYVPHEEVPMYSYAADFAIILRDDTIVNQAASPVKFSEYLASGAMVIISNNIGDLPSIVGLHNLGFVVGENYGVFEFESPENFCNEKTKVANATRCRDIAEKEFSVGNSIRIFEKVYCQFKKSEQQK